MGIGLLLSIKNFHYGLSFCKNVDGIIRKIRKDSHRLLIAQNKILYHSSMVDINCGFSSKRIVYGCTTSPYLCAICTSFVYIAVDHYHYNTNALTMALYRCKFLPIVPGLFFCHHIIIFRSTANELNEFKLAFSNCSLHIFNVSKLKHWI